jgi:BirA family biotin operon repressor/biotin-[acetyl-CoA-carboxylase] ligase
MKGQILKNLRQHDGYLSGEMLSERLGVSRVTIWKHVRTLRNDGYSIDASPAGYRLLSCHYFREIGSTMDAARELARKGAAEGTIVIAETQTRGRGRLSREWLSPRGGIYLTLILRPRISPAYAPRINLMASIAVASTIRKLFGLRAELKWPNDVQIGGKKVCGILAEMNAEMDVVNFVNIGTNVNNSVSRFREVGTSLRDELGRGISRKQFLSALLAEMDERRAILMEPELLQEYRRLSCTLGKDIRMTSLGEEVTGKAIDIDAMGALVLKEKDGSLRTVVVGDCIHLS